MAGPERQGDQAPADALAELRSRLSGAEQYLRIAELRAPPGRARDPRPPAPDLWDDQDHARAVTTELGRVSSDLDDFDALDRALGDAEVLVELVAESQQRRRARRGPRRPS